MSTSRYNSLAQAESDKQENQKDERDSEAEVDGLEYTTPMQLQRDARTLRLFVLCTIAVAFLAICGLLVANLSRSPSRCDCPQMNTSQPPVFETHTTQYGNDIRYMSLEHRYDHLWESELSGRDQLIRLNWEQTDEIPNWSTRGMFHHLHCLAGIRKALQRAREGEDIGVNHLDDPHWPHCLYYMRQAILCSADDTVELPNRWASRLLENGTTMARHIGAISGVYDLRVCRNSEKLFKLRGEHGHRVERLKIALMKNHSLHTTEFVN